MIDLGRIARILGELATVVRVQNGNQHDDINALIERAESAHQDLVIAEAGWQPIAIVPEGVVVLLSGGKTIFSGKWTTIRAGIVEDRAGLYKSDGTLRPSSPTQWHAAPSMPDEPVEG